MPRPVVTLVLLMAVFSEGTRPEPSRPCTGGSCAASKGGTALLQLRHSQHRRADDTGGDVNESTSNDSNASGDLNASEAGSDANDSAINGSNESGDLNASAAGNNITSGSEVAGASVFDTDDDTMDILVEIQTSNTDFAGTETGASIAFEVDGEWTADADLVDMVPNGVLVTRTVRLLDWPTQLRISAKGEDSWHYDSIVLKLDGYVVVVLDNAIGIGNETNETSHSVTAEWVIRVLSEAPDEDRLEDGESVRLLTQVVSSMVGADSFTEEAWLNLMSKFDLATSASPARNAALFGGAFDATSGRDPMSDSSPDDGLASYQAAAAPSPQHCSKRQHILVQAFRHIQPVVFKAAIVETAAVECGPLLLEMLLEVAASAMDMAGGSEELSCMMLWELVGWDSPKARRTLRELCRAFDRYARDGELSSSGFTKFCLDVGWANNRDNATKSARFASIFEDVAGTEVQGAHFIEFLVMIETIMRDILRAQAERDDGTQVWQALQMAISRLLGSSGPRSKMAPLAKKKAPASPRHILPKGFWTEDIGFHIHDAFAHVADKAMSPPLAMPTTSTVDPLTLGHVLSKQTEEQENSEERSRQNEAQVLDDMHVEELDTAFDAHDVANAVQRVRRSAMQTHGEGFQYDDQPLLQHVFSAHEGRVCSSSDALVEQMTVAEARFRCLQLKGCQGFSFEGDPSTKEVVTVHFTKAWGDCEGEGWTSLKLAGEFVEEEQAEEDGPEANHATCDDKLQRHRVFERDSGADADSKGDETEEDLGEEEKVAEEVVDDLDVLPQVAVPTGDSCGWQSLAKASVVLPADGEDSGESMFGQSPTNLCNPVFVGASTDGASVAPTSHKEQPHISTRTVVIGSQADDSSRQKASRERDLKHLMDS